MSLHYGNWCGAGWSAKQYKDAKDLTEEDKKVPAIDELDQACKNHDIGIAEGDPNANPHFYEEAMATGWLGTAMAGAVAVGGPPSHSYLRSDKKMAGKKTSKKPTKDTEYQTRKGKGSLKKVEKDYADELTGQSFVEAINDVKAPASKRKPSAGLDDDDSRTRDPIEYDEFPVNDPDDAIYATIDEEMNQGIQGRNVITPMDMDYITPQRDTPAMQPRMTREDQPLRGARPIGSLTNLLNQQDMAEEDVEMAPMARSASVAADAGNPSKQRSVAVRYDSRQEMGFLTETRTAMLPLTIFFSVNKLDATEPVAFKFVLNDTYNIFRYQSFTKQTFPVAASNGHAFEQYTTVVPANSGTTGHTLTASYTPAYYAQPVNRLKGVSPDMAYSLLQVQENGVKYNKPIGVNYGRALQFPFTTKSVTVGSATETSSGKLGYGVGNASGDYPMAWRNYYERIYRSRHVMKTEWRLTMENAQEGAFHRAVVMENVDTITDAPQSSTYITPTDKPLAQMLRFKRIKENRLKALNVQGGSPVNILSGTWSDNSNRRRDVVDEENVSTWYPTGAENGPAGKQWQEIQTLLFYNDQFSGNQNGYFNCRLDLLYHVQYRDLKSLYRYASYEDTNTVMLSTNETCFPTGQPPANNWPTDDEVDSYKESIELAGSHNFVK